jgi:cephalosporin hydroxylase
MNSFDQEVMARIASNGSNEVLKTSAQGFMLPSLYAQYSYNFSWMGRPIIQYPQDMIALQEIIWAVQPDLIIETGIAHGGSLIFWAAMLELNAACGGPQNAEVLGVDIDIRAHNRKAIEAHPMAKRISMIQGSSIAPEIIEHIKGKAMGKQRVMVCLDSNHTHDHVLAELEAYARLTSVGSYCVVFDTIIENMPAEMFPDRPWGPGNNPKTAVWEWIKEHPEFEIDRSVADRLLITSAPDGFLRRIFA